MPPDPHLALSIVVPLFDEAVTLRELKHRVCAELESRSLAFELLFVDDGSSDGTGAILAELEQDDPRVRVYQFTRNFGQAAALACGLFEARGDVVVTLDGDLQNPPEEIPKLLEALEKGAQVATGRRSRRYEGRLRWLGSRAIHLLARWLLGALLDDFGGQFKAYRRPVVEEVRRRWAPGKPIFPLAVWLGFPVAEVEVAHEPRRVGGSRYSLGSLLRINADLITSFSTFPLALLGVAGAVCFALGAVGVVLCLAAGEPGWFAGAAALSLLGVGSLLLGMGVLGVYLGRIYLNVSGRAPDWVLRRGPRDVGRGEA